MTGSNKTPPPAIHTQAPTSARQQPLLLPFSHTLHTGRWHTVLPWHPGTLVPAHAAGKFNERRRGMYDTEMFRDVGNAVGGFSGQRDIHMGLDIGGPVDTPVLAFADGPANLAIPQPPPPVRASAAAAAAAHSPTRVRSKAPPAPPARLLCLARSLLSPSHVVLLNGYCGTHLELAGAAPCDPSYPVPTRIGVLIRACGPML